MDPGGSRNAMVRTSNEQNLRPMNRNRIGDYKVQTTLLNKNKSNATRMLYSKCDDFTKGRSPFLLREACELGGYQKIETDQ